MTTRIRPQRLSELKNTLHELQGIRSNIVFCGADVGHLLKELLGYIEADQPAPPETEPALPDQPHDGDKEKP